MKKSIKSKTTNGLIWAFLDTAGGQIIHFFIVLFLARILLPEEFGLVAMLTIFIAISSSLIDSGFGAAIIQKQNVTPLDECSVFYLNIFVGFTLTFILWLLSPVISNFYEIPELKLILKVISLSLIIDSFGIIHYTLLKKKIMFNYLAKVSLFSSLFSGLIGLLMAYYGFGVWSLVLYTISNKFFRLILYWIYNDWRPSLLFSLESIKSMAKYGSNILGVGLINTFFKNIYLLIIGKIFGPADLGFYQRALSIQQMPSTNISGVINRVTFSVFSTMQDDRDTLKKVFIKFIKSTSMLIFPIMVGLFICAKSLIIFLLTEKWVPSVQYIQLLCFIGITYPISMLNLNLLKSIGNSGLYFRLEIFYKFLILLAILFTYNKGLYNMVIGQVIAYNIIFLTNCFFVGKILKYNVNNQIVDLLPTLLISISMGVIIYLFEYFDLFYGNTLLIFQVITGIIFYVFICVIFRIESFFQIISLIKNKLNEVK